MSNSTSNAEYKAWLLNNPHPSVDQYGNRYMTANDHAEQMAAEKRAWINDQQQQAAQRVASLSDQEKMDLDRRMKENAIKYSNAAIYSKKYVEFMDPMAGFNNAINDLFNGHRKVWVPPINIPDPSVLLPPSEDELIKARTALYQAYLKKNPSAKTAKIQFPDEEILKQVNLTRAKNTEQVIAKLYELRSTNPKAYTEKLTGYLRAMTGFWVEYDGFGDVLKSYIADAFKNEDVKKVMNDVWLGVNIAAATAIMIFSGGTAAALLFGVFMACSAKLEPLITQTMDNLVKEDQGLRAQDSSILKIGSDEAGKLIDESNGSDAPPDTTSNP